MRGSNFSKLLFVALLAAVSCATLSASPILFGTFNISGNLTVDNNGTGGCASAGGCITWTDPPATLGDKADIAGSGLSGAFTVAGFSGNDQANISDLHNPPESVGPPPFASQPFMSFNGGGITTTLLINFIAAGIYPSSGCAASPAAVGQVCTTPGSLFSFVNNPGGTNGQATASWVLSGVTNDGLSTWTSIFTSQFNVPFQVVFGNLGAFGAVTNSYSATFTVTPNSTSPEPPASILMGFGLGLVVLAAGLRRRLASR